MGYGHSRGRNVIIMNSDKRSEYIARVDGDCRTDPNRLMNLWNAIKHNTDTYVAGA